MGSGAMGCNRSDQKHVREKGSAKKKKTGKQGSPAAQMPDGTVAARPSLTRQKQDHLDADERFGSPQTTHISDATISTGFKRAESNSPQVDMAAGTGGFASLGTEEQLRTGIDESLKR